jgi:outer membrane receptor protein involved in Fe transport
MSARGTTDRLMCMLALAAVSALVFALPVSGLQRSSAPVANKLMVIHGYVVTPDGLPLPGAVVTGGGMHVATAADGSFTIPVAVPAQIGVSATGFKSTTIAVSASPARITLQPAPLAESVTVVGSARNAGVTSDATNTEVMAGERLRIAAASNADSVLRQFSSFVTFRRSTSLNSHPTSQGVSLLGAGSSGASRTLVVLDDLPLNDAFGGWVDWLRVPDIAISEVSVVEGGASSLYGNDALTGSVSMDTLQPSSDLLLVRAGGGNLGSRFVDSMAALGSGKLMSDVRIRSIHQAGFIPVPANLAGPVDDDLGVTAADIAPELRFVPSARAMFVVGGEYFGERRQNGTVLQRNSTALRQLDFRGVLDDFGVWRAAAFSQSETFASSFSSINPTRTVEKLVLDQRVPVLASGAMLDWSDTAGPVQVVAGGSWTRVGAMDSEFAPLAKTDRNRSNDGRQNLEGTFVELRGDAAPSLLLTAAVREDWWRNYDGFLAEQTGTTRYSDRSTRATSPSAGLVWRVHGPLSLRASAYESFRAPTLNELYRPFRLGNIQTLANPLLAAERYRGYQAGADYAVGSSWLLRATYFDGWLSNVITNVTLSATPVLITEKRENLGRVRPRGEEFSLRRQALSWLTLWGSYTHLNSDVTVAPEVALIGKQIPHMPRNNASAEALGTWHGWQTSLEERFGGYEFEDDRNTITLPSFWTTDLYVSRTLPSGPDWLRGLAPYIGIENLWNRRYAVAVTPTPNLNSPRAVTAGVQLQFGAR